MKRIKQYKLFSIIIVALLFVGFFIIPALAGSDTATVNVRTEEVSRMLFPSGTDNVPIYNMIVKADSPGAIKGMNVAISYDPQLIQPVEIKTAIRFADVTGIVHNAATPKSCFSVLGYYEGEMIDEEFYGENYDISAVAWHVSDTRNAFAYALSTTATPTYAAEQDMFSFNFRVADGYTVTDFDRTTFQVETDRSDDGILSSFNLDPAQRSGIKIDDALIGSDPPVGTGERHTLESVDYPAVVTAFTYPGSNRLAKPTVEIEPNTSTGTGAGGLSFTITDTINSDSETDGYIVKIYKANSVDGEYDDLVGTYDVSAKTGNIIIDNADPLADLVVGTSYKATAVAVGDESTWLSSNEGELSDAAVASTNVPAPVAPSFTENSIAVTADDNGALAVGKGITDINLATYIQSGTGANITGYTVTTGDLPAGITLNTATGKISGIFSEVETSGSATITVSDNSTPALTDTIEITWDAIGKGTGVFAGTVTYTKTYGDAAFVISELTYSGDGTPITYALKTGDQAGTFDNSNNTVTITTAGTITVVATAPDGTNYFGDTKDIVITVNKNSAYTFTGPADQSMAVGGDGSSLSHNTKGSGVGDEDVDGTFKWFSDSARTTEATAAWFQALTVNSSNNLYWSFTPEADGDYSGAKTGQITLTISALPPQVVDFTAGNQSKTYGDGSFTPAYTIKTSGGASISSPGAATFGSSDEDVATIDEATGEITIIKAGSTTISLNVAATADYAAGSANFTLTVNAKSITITSATITKVYDGNNTLNLADISNVVWNGTLNSDDPGITAVTGTYDVAGITAGSVTITAITLDDANYTVTTAPSVVISSGVSITKSTPAAPGAGDATIGTPGDTNIAVSTTKVGLQYGYRTGSDITTTWATYTAGKIIGLNPNTIYKIYIRYAATANTNASEEVFVGSATTTKKQLTLVIGKEPTASGTYGDEVGELAIAQKTDDVTYNSITVAGAWSFGINTAVPEVGTSTAYTATFTPTANAGDYQTLTCQIIPTISKADQTAPTSFIGTMGSHTSTSIVMSGTNDVDYVYGYRLASDTTGAITWLTNGLTTVDQDHQSITGLSINTSYNLFIKKAATANYNESPAYQYTSAVSTEKGTLVLVTGKAPTASGTYGQRVDQLTINQTTGDVTCNGTVVAGTWSFGTNATIPTVASPGTYTATFTATTNSANYKALTYDITPTISKANQTAPSAFVGTIGTIASTSVVVTGADDTTYNYGYRVKDSAAVITWLSALGSIDTDQGYTGLAMNTEYNFYVRYPADANHNVSSETAHAAVVKTLKGTLVLVSGKEPTASGTYGKRVDQLTINQTTGDVTCNSSAVSGTWSFGTNATIPTVASPGAYTATFTPAANAQNYQALTYNITPTITAQQINSNVSANIIVNHAGGTDANKIDAGDVLSIQYVNTMNVPSGSLSYKWTVGTNTNAGTAATYTVTAADPGKNISVTITASGNYTGSRVAGPVTVNKIMLTGTLTVQSSGVDVAQANAGQTLTAKMIGSNDTAAGYSFYWLRDGQVISNTASTAYTTVASDRGCNITVKAVANEANQVYTGTVNSSNSVFVVPIAPTAPVISITKGNAKLTIKYTAAVANGSPVTGYDIRVTDNSTYDQTFGIAASLTSYVVTGLTNGTTYYVTVTAKSAYGNTASATVSGVPSGKGSDEEDKEADDHINYHGGDVRTNNGITTFTFDVSVKKGSIDFTVAENDFSDAVDAALADKASTVCLDIQSDDHADQIDVQLDRTSLRELYKRSNAKLRVATELGDIIIQRSDINDLLELDADDYTFVITKDSKTGYVSFDVLADGKSVASVSGMMVALPVVNSNAGFVAQLVNGTDKTVIAFSAVINGYLYAEVDGPSTINLIDNSKYYSDINGHWGYQGMMFVSARELFQGVSADKFDPNGKMTRAMGITVDYRLAGSPAVSGYGGFSDVVSGKWYSDSIYWGYTNNIVNGMGGGRFYPNANINRGQLVQMMYLYAVNEGRDVNFQVSLASYSDYLQIPTWNNPAMGWAVGIGLVYGKEGNRIDAYGEATRAEVAAIIQRYIVNILTTNLQK